MPSREEVVHVHTNYSSDKAYIFNNMLNAEPHFAPTVSYSAKHWPTLYSMPIKTDVMQILLLSALWIAALLENRNIIVKHSRYCLQPHYKWAPPQPIPSGEVNTVKKRICIAITISNNYIVTMFIVILIQASPKYINQLWITLNVCALPPAKRTLYTLMGVEYLY